MFGMGFGEIILVCMVVLVVLGPEKIPDVARTLGKTLREVRRATNMLRDAVMIEEQGRNQYRPSPAASASVAPLPHSIALAEIEPYREVLPVTLTPAKLSDTCHTVDLKAPQRTTGRRYVRMNCAHGEWTG